MNARTITRPRRALTPRARVSSAAHDPGNGIAPAGPGRAKTPAPARHALKLTGNRCQCTACGEYFNGVQPFDKHRVGGYANAEQPNTRRCLTVAELEVRGWVRNAAGFWCERATKPHVRPRAPVFPAPRAPSAMQHHCPTPSAPESARAGSP